MINKFLFLFILLVSLLPVSTNCQSFDENSNVKLFLDRANINDNNDWLELPQKERLYLRMTQIINHTSVTEIGYSNFLVTPKLDLINISVDEAGITKVYLAETELYITIRRISISGPNQIGGATFATFSKKIMGSGSSKKEAVDNAINLINKNDSKLVSFFVESKDKIKKYYQEHCNDIIEEAERSLDFKDYEMAVSLFFSVPIDAPCGSKARDRSIGVYNKFIADKCGEQVLKINTYLALANNESTLRKNYYDSVLIIMNKVSLNPACKDQANAIITKIEAQLDERQKQEIELYKLVMNNEKELEKARYKAIGKMYQNYQPVLIIK